LILLTDSPLPPEGRMPNGIATGPGSTGRPSSRGGTNWPSGPTGGTQSALAKPPPGRDPKSRARSRDYLKQFVYTLHCLESSSNALPPAHRCLQEISYLTSPQAMNPLPNRPLLNNTSLPLTLPNVPSFDQMAYNGRPRKSMPDSGKDFPLLNGIGMMQGSSSAPTPSGNQIPPLERGNPLGGGGIMHSQHHHQQQQQPQMQQGIGQPQQLQLHHQQMDKDKDGDEPRQLTAIFRPDEAGEWKERLRLSHEAEQARQSGAASWDRRDDDDGKDEDGEVEDEDSGVVGDGEGTKVWKAKRTLRK
jgi:striatin 1/3/4